jgi:dTDP-glucose pyrophosphorylase
MALVGVVPAAGYAERLQPLEGSKEMLPVKGRPVIDYLLERMRLAAPADIRVVTRPEKHDVAHRAAELGATVMEGRPANVADSLLLGLQGLASDDLVLFGFPDTVWEPRDGFVRLLGALDERSEIVLGLFRTPEAARSDVVTVSGDRVTGVYPKPTEPQSELIWGCLAGRLRGFHGLEGHAEPGAFVHELAVQGLVRAVDFETQFLDVGTPAAYARATA